MLTLILAAAAFFFLTMWAINAFNVAILNEEKYVLTLCAERAIKSRDAARFCRREAECDALSARAETVEAQDKLDRLKPYVRAILRQRSQLQSLQLNCGRVYNIEKTQFHVEATKSANLN